MEVIDIINKYGRASENILNILMDYQNSKEDNFISREDIKTFSEKLGIPKSRIYSLLTFYTLLSEKQRGKYVIQVCGNIPCHVNGSENVLEILKNKLEIEVNETTEDGLFTLEMTSCIGYCDKAPVIRINQRIFGNLDNERIEEIIEFYRGGKMDGEE